MSLLTRFLNLFRCRNVDLEVEEEIAFHMRSRIERYIEEGMSAQDAEAAAQRQFGDRARAKRAMLEVRIMRKTVAFTILTAVAATIVAGVLWLRRAEISDEGQQDLQGQSGQQIQSPYYRIGDEGVTPPKPVYKKNPNYPVEAQNAKVQGTIEVGCVVQATGACSDIRVTKSLDPMWLDEEAVRAVREWRFTPGTRMGDVVPVMVNIELRFTLS